MAAAGVLLLVFSFGTSKTHAQAPAAKATTIGQLELLAEEGDPLASYRLAKIFADGKGVEQSDIMALMWLRCAAGSDYIEAVKDVKAATYRKRAQVEARAGPIVAFLGNALAALRCSSGRAWNPPYSPNREVLWELLFFLPGDITLLLCLYCCYALDLTWLYKFILMAYQDLGNILVGIMSILLWLSMTRTVLGAFNSVNSSSRAWMRTPARLRVSMPVTPRKELDKRTQPDEQDTE
jgi:hypothetical protein